MKQRGCGEQVGRILKTIERIAENHPEKRRVAEKALHQATTARQVVAILARIAGGRNVEGGRQWGITRDRAMDGYGGDLQDPGEWTPKSRGPGKCYYETGNEADRCYVTRKGGPGGQRKRKNRNPAGKPGSAQRRKYNEEYRRMRWGL